MRVNNHLRFFSVRGIRETAAEEACLPDDYVKRIEETEAVADRFKEREARGFEIRGC